MPADASSSTPVDHAALARLLDRFAQVALGGVDARDLTDWLLRRIAELTGWPVAHALLVDPHGALTSWFSLHSNETEWAAYTLAADGLAMRTPTGLLDRVIVTRRPGWVGDIADEADYPRAAAARAAGLRGVFAFPVVRGDSVVALMQFLSREPIEPDIDFLDGMTIAGFRLGRAFDQFRLQGESVDQPSRLHRIRDAGSRAFLVVGTDNRIAQWTRGAERLFGWTGAEAMYRSSTDLLLPPESRDAATTPTPQPVGADPLALRREVVLQRRDGTTFPAEVSRWPVPSSAPEQHYIFCRDISERHQRSSGQERDPLTGLMNRAGLLDALAGELGRGTDDTDPVLILIGLQRFKEIDYSLDHHVADEALRVIGARVAAMAEAGSAGAAVSARVQPVAARVAGDEFAILFPGAHTRGGAPGASGGQRDGASGIARLAERVADAIAEPFEAAGRRLALTAHVGAAEPMVGSDVHSWFGDAEAALYRSRYGADAGPQRTAHGNFEVEGFARRQGRSWRQSLPAEMHDALTGDQFELFYQPIFGLPGENLVGAEALIRWHHPQQGLLLPGAFIGAAEDSGMIGPIGEWVLRQAARQLRSWEGAGLRIAVNLCARQLAEPGIVAHIAEAVDLAGGSVAGSGLVVEMTESVLMADPEVAATRIGQFREMGVQISIDDFGTGYSSLAYLKWFDVDIIKIDMSFVHGMETSRTDAAIVRTIIDLARELNLRVVAEGVETDSQLRRLTEWGCTYVQGFGLARPGPATALTERLHPTAGH